MQPIHRLNSDEERDDENDRNGEEAQDEPRAQGHFRGAKVCESYSLAVASPAPRRTPGCWATHGVHRRVAYLDPFCNIRGQMSVTFIAFFK